MSRANSKDKVLPVEQSPVKIYLRLMGYVKPYFFIFSVSVLGYVIYAASNVLFSKIMESLVRAIESGDPHARYWVPLQVIGVTVVRGIGAFLGAYFIARVSYGVIHNLRVQVFNHMLHLPADIFDKRKSGHLVSIITYNINGVTAAATDALKIGLREGMTVIGLFAYLLYLDWKLTLVFVAVAPFIGLLVSRVARRLRRLSGNVQTTVGDITQVTSEMINGYRVVRSFGGENYEMQRFENASKKNYLQNMKIVVTSAANTPLMQLLIALAMAVLIFAALSFMNLKSTAEFMGYMTTVGMILNPMRRLGEVAPLMLKGLAAADSVFQLLDESAEIDTGQYHVDRATGAVSFEQVSFAYPGQQVPALDHVDVNVAPGEVVALVGRSGSGKSTLVNLLPRFYDITQGAIKLDGVAINDYTLTNLRAQLAFVNQQVTLFDGSVAENIAYGCADKITSEQIKRAADLAYASEFIEKLPQGFNTQIGESGARLSGGQRQRLAIARAILKNAPILIMDEATSALDNESERYIQAAMDEVMKGRTTFVIAHRLSTIEHADRILVLDAGKIVEQGTHHSLLALNGLYAKLHSTQFSEDSA